MGNDGTLTGIIKGIGTPILGIRFRVVKDPSSLLSQFAVALLAFYKEKSPPTRKEELAKHRYPSFGLILRILDKNLPSW